MENQFMGSMRHLALRMAAKAMDIGEIEAYRMISETNTRLQEWAAGKPSMAATKWNALRAINEFFDIQKPALREAFYLLEGIHRPEKVLDLFGAAGLGAAELSDRYPKAQITYRYFNSRHKIAEISRLFFPGRHIYGSLEKENFDSIFAWDLFGQFSEPGEAYAAFAAAAKTTNCNCFVLVGLSINEEQNEEFRTKIIEDRGWKSVEGINAMILWRKSATEKAAKK